MFLYNYYNYVKNAFLMLNSTLIFTQKYFEQWLENGALHIPLSAVAIFIALYFNGSHFSSRLC